MVGYGKVLGEVLENVLGCMGGERRCGKVWGRHGKLQHTSHFLPHFPKTLFTLLHPPPPTPQHTFPHLSQHFLSLSTLQHTFPHLPPHFPTQHTFPHLPQHFFTHTLSPLTPQHTFPHLYPHFSKPPAPAPAHFPIPLPTFFHTSPNTSLISNISLHPPHTSLYTSAHLTTLSHTLHTLPHP